MGKFVVTTTLELQIMIVKCFIRLTTARRDLELSVNKKLKKFPSKVGSLKSIFCFEAIFIPF